MFGAPFVMALSIGLLILLAQGHGSVNVMAQGDQCADILADQTHPDFFRVRSAAIITSAGCIGAPIVPIVLLDYK